MGAWFDGGLNEICKFNFCLTSSKISILIELEKATQVAKYRLIKNVFLIFLFPYTYTHYSKGFKVLLIYKYIYIYNIIYIYIIYIYLHA